QEIASAMALRLTTASAPKTVGRTPAELGALARTLLQRGDVAAFKALFGEVAQEADPHRRYRARTTLIEVGMGNHAEPKNVAKVLLATAQGAVEILEDEAREPVLLNYAGVIFYELGALGAAEHLFKAARRLDQDLPNVGRSLDQIARRRRAGVDVLAGLPAHVAMELKALAKRIDSIVGRAKAVEGKTISLTMIVKDEEEM